MNAMNTRITAPFPIFQCSLQTVFQEDEQQVEKSTNQPDVPLSEGQLHKGTPEQNKKLEWGCAILNISPRGL